MIPKCPDCGVAHRKEATRRECAKRAIIDADKTRAVSAEQVGFSLSQGERIRELVAAQSKLIEKMREAAEHLMESLDAMDGKSPGKACPYERRALRKVLSLTVEDFLPKK